MENKIEFGWLLPTRRQRMPLEGITYDAHICQVLDRIHGRFHSIWMPDQLMDGQETSPLWAQQMMSVNSCKNIWLLEWIYSFYLLLTNRGLMA